MTTLRDARLRAFCCGDACQHEAGYFHTCKAPHYADRLAAHDAALEVAGIPISKLLDGTWCCVPKTEGTLREEQRVAAAAEVKP